MDAGRIGSRKRAINRSKRLPDPHHILSLETANMQSEEEAMIREYIEAAMARARYEIIQDEEPFYGEVPELQGVWASGKTLEECRRNLAEGVDGWVLIRLARGLPIPSLGDVTLAPPGEMSVA